MNMLKRSFAMLLALCMLVSAVPVNAFAAEATDLTEPIVLETDAPEVTEAPIESETPTESEVPTESEIPTEGETTSEEETPTEGVTVPEEETPTEGVTIPEEETPTEGVTIPEEEDPTEDETVPEETEEFFEIGWVSEEAISGVNTGTNPGSGGPVSGEPFIYGTAGSNSFRIPALVTLSNGNLLAAADARWNTTYDGGGLDTIVSVSSDNGANWYWSMANYLGDNGNEYNGSSSTAFIDPALAVSGNTVYMLCDLYPYGIALNGSGNTHPSTDTGFNSNGYLKLDYNGAGTYSYYLDGTTIRDSSGNAVSGYTVDEYFNITGTNVDSNLFFSDSPFKVARTGFLYLTKSTDGGESWSAPELLNLKNGSEQVCLVAPGRGLVTSDGDVVFPTYHYHYNNGSPIQYMSFITYNGKSWSRSASMTGASWSSESAVVELSDGTLRFFYRNGTTNLCYVDYKDGWKTPVTMTNIDTNSNCQISAITYSKTIDGKQVILVSCPTGPNEAGSNQSGASYRLNGKIFLFTVGEDNGLTLVNSKNVTSGGAQFMYSCLTEQKDGSVSILYEDCENDWGYSDHDGDGLEAYYTMSFATYDVAKDFGVTFDAVVNNAELTDQATGVKVKFANTDNQTYTMTVTPNQTVAALEEEYVAFDVTITNAGGTKYEGSASVTLPLGALADKTGIYPFVVEANGTVTKIETFTVENGTITFTAPHFSVLGAAVEAQEPVISGEDKVDGTTTTTTTVSWELATSITAGKEYIIVNTNSGSGNALTNNNNNVGNTAVTISDGKITAVNGEAVTNDNTANIQWTFASATSGTVSNNGRYLYPSSSGLSLSTSSSTSVNISNRTNGAYRIYLPSGDYYYYPAYSIYSNGWTASYTRWPNFIGSVYLFGKNESTTTVGAYKVDAALQESRIAAYTVENEGYTDASWNAYQAALTAAQNKLAEVERTDYLTQDAANAALTEELITVVDALEAAKKALVKAVAITIQYQAAGTTVLTATLNVAAGDTTVTLPSTVTNGTNSYKVDETTLTIDPANTILYKVPVTLMEGTEVSIKEKETMELTVDLEDGQYVEWASENANYVGVAGKYDAAANAYTNTGVIVGQNVTTEPILVTGTVYNANGTKAAVHKWLVTVTEGDADDNTSSKHIYVNATAIENCTVYYAINAGELIKLNGTGVVIDADVTGHFNMMFFADPDEGYALTYMSVSGSAKQYYTLSDGNPDGTGSGAWPFDSVTQTTIPTSSDDSAWVSGHGFRWALLEGNYGIDQMKAMFSQAIALGCDGATNFTKNGSESFYTEVQFAAQKLPTMEKVITSIRPASATEDVAYTEGMELGIGDTINYTITITEYAEETGPIYSGNTYTVTSPITTSNRPTYTTGSYGTITYSNTSLTDELTGNAGIDTTPDLGTSSTTASALTYNTSITLGANNFLQIVKDGKITNVADLSYHYSSQYSTGTLNTSSQAVAEILVEVPEYVIDFGLPITVDLDNDPLVAGDKILKAVATYGNVAITGDRTFTYTPTTILQGPDFVTLTFADGGNETAIIGYGVRIYPATTVFYEEGFVATAASGWTGGSKGSSRSQTAERINAEDSSNNPISVQQYVYGYDPIYANDINASNGTEAAASAIGTTTSFTFTGTGFDLYANCTMESGRVSVQVRNSENKLVKVYTVDTIVKGGETAATEKQTGNEFHLPIVSVDSLAYGTYTVSLVKIADTEPVKIDGVRIHNTVKDSSVFTIDLEDNPVFYELRDAVLKAVDVSKTASEMYGDDWMNDKSLIGPLAEQVYGALSTTDTVSAVVTSVSDIYSGDADAQDLLDNGPKNELFLYPSQTLTFKVTTDREMQIGLKAPRTATSYTMTRNGTAVATEKALNTSVDMFYALGNPTGTSTEYTVSVTNTGSDILSVTDLKICDDPNAAFVPLTVDDIEYILTQAGVGGQEPAPEEPTDPEEPIVPEEPEVPVIEYADAVLKINLVDYTGKQLAAAELTANGIKGEENAFAGAAVLRIAERNLPKGYALVTKQADAVKVAYGEETTVSVQIGKVATVKVTFVNLLGRKVGTATITKVQTDAAPCRITAAEIRSLAPVGRLVIRLTSVTAVFGSTTNVIVPVV